MIPEVHTSDFWPNSLSRSLGLVGIEQGLDFDGRISFQQVVDSGDDDLQLKNCPMSQIINLGSK